MTNHTMPMLTDEQREMLAGLAKIEIRRWDKAAESVPEKKYMAELMQIALAALTAKPAAYTSQNNLDEASKAKPKNIEFMTGDKNLYQHPVSLYTAPPVPALKLPDEMTHSYHDEYAQATCLIWNNCLAEVKRMNGVTQ